MDNSWRGEAPFNRRKEKKAGSNRYKTGAQPALFIACFFCAQKLHLAGNKVGRSTSGGLGGGKIREGDIVKSSSL